jgi:hypothetical protein
VQTLKKPGRDARTRHGAIAWKRTARRHWRSLTVVAALGVAAVLALVLWPAPASRQLPPPRARVYLAFDACLLTGAQGLADPATAPVWSGMQDASNATAAKVSYLAAAGPTTVGNALPYLAALLQRHCDVVLSVGPAQLAAVNQEAPNNPAVHFIDIGGAGSSTNISVVSNGPASDVRTTVATLIRNLVH